MKNQLLRALNKVDLLLKPKLIAQKKSVEEDSVSKQLGATVVSDAKKVANGHRYTSKQMKYIKAACAHFKNAKVVNQKCALVGIHVPVNTCYRYLRQLKLAAPVDKKKRGKKPLPIDFELSVLNELMVNGTK